MNSINLRKKKLQVEKVHDLQQIDLQLLNCEQHRRDLQMRGIVGFGNLQAHPHTA